MAKKMKRRKRTPWNKGVEVGQRAPFSTSEVSRIRKLLLERGDAGLKHRALFSTALDTMLRSPDLLGLTVKDVRKRNGEMRDTFVLAPRGQRSVPVQCTLSKTTSKILQKLICETGKKPRDYLFTGRFGGGLSAISPRQLNRIIKSWVVDVGLDESAYGIESLRRTRADAMYNRTGDMEAVRDLLGLKDIDAAEKYLSNYTR